MSFTPQSSFSAMSRLGRAKGLLDRKRLDNGNTLMGRIVSFINQNKNQGGLLTILGHPSAGKTTEFNRLARDLSSNTKFADEFYPLYTELQNAEITSEFTENEFIWQGIVSGSIDVQLHEEQASKSLEEFCKHCKSYGKKPVLLIDTLDILMLHQIGDDGVNVAKLWANFLQDVIDNQVTMVWTCRPFEWKFFQREIVGKYLNRIEVEELPQLETSQLLPFTKITTFDLVTDSKTNESDGKDFISEINDNTDWPEQEAWEKWTINFQSHMPIFADRWSGTTKKSKKLDDDLFLKFAKDFRNYTQSDLSQSHWYEFVKELPSQYLYSWIWDKISLRMENTYSISNELISELKSVFEIEAKNIALNYSNNSSRVRLEYNQLSDTMKEKCGIDEVTVNDLFNVCESRGLLSRNGIWVDFSHQLLFEESILNSEPDDDEKRQLEKFPSILLRTKRDVRLFSKSQEILRDEVMNAVGNWTGYMLAYHPACISIMSNLDPTWSKWVEYSHANVNLKVPDLEVNEHTEKRIALQKYEQSVGIKSLIVNGAPGTGKTYFCRDYLRWILARNRSQNKSVKWRYYTLNNHLAEHFDELVSEYSERDPEMKSDLENSKGGSFSIDRLLAFINPNINRHKSITDRAGIGLLTFSVFKVLIRQYFDQKSVRHSGVKCPPLADAWILYNEVLHDPITGSRRQDMDKKKFTELNTQTFRMNSKMIDWFIKFHEEKLEEFWWTYSYAASDCRQRLENLSDIRRSQYLIDVLIVDEVQDINPPVMALLLELMRPGYDNHSIMIAGDMVQTVNRSGFQWINFSEMTAQSLKDSYHPDKSRLIQFGVLDKSELDKNRTTLKYVWRNGQRLVEFNNKMRKNYASSFGISEQYSALFDYPGGELLISEASRLKDLDSEITIIESESVDDYYALIDELAKASKDLVGEDIAVIAPFDIEDEWNEKFNIPVYDAESVKGLEFEGIVVLMPYLIPENEARSSLIRRLGESNDEVQSQIQKWCDAWTDNKLDASQVNFENFNQLFLNVMTRMNVLFSRPEKRILVINPVRFGGEVQIFDHPKNDEKMMSFGIPELPRDVKINSRKEMSMIETLRVPIGEYSNKSHSFTKLLSKALNQASLNDDGTQTDNERKVWDNLWFNLEGDDKAPLSAIAYAGGISYSKNSEAIRLLRSDLGRKIDLMSGKSSKESENQLFSIISQSNIDSETGTLTIRPDYAHFIFSKLESLMRNVLRESLEYEKLHEFMMNRLFGIDIRKIPQYEFESFLESEIAMANMSLHEFSESIVSTKYMIEQQTKKYREIILYHIASKLREEEVMVIEQPEWDDESESIWMSVMECIEDNSFDKEIIQNLYNYNLVELMQYEFKNRQPKHGLVASNRKSWRGLISEEKISPMHLAAWKILHQVITNLHNHRTEFSARDEFYLTVYDALKLSIDIDGMRIFHELLEISINDQSPESTFEDNYNSVIKKHASRFEHGRDTLPSMINQLEKHWFSRDVNRQTHLFNAQKGASVIGCLIHLSYLMNSQWKNSLRRRESILHTVEKQMNRYFSNSTKGLHLNAKDYWLKYNLQDSTFRNLLALILQVDKATITQQIEGSVTEFLSKLLMMDYVAMSDQNWPSPKRRDPGMSDVVPDFSGSGPDKLTKQILDTSLALINWKTDVRFFKTYISSLDQFLDSESMQKSIKRRRKKDPNYSLRKYRNDRPAEFMNQELWKAWEWLLHMMYIYPELEQKWKMTLSDKTLTKGLSQRLGLHQYLRLNNMESVFTNVVKNIYNKQYLPILDILRSKKINDNQKLVIAYNALDFTEYKRRPKSAEWQNLQRLAYSKLLKQEHGLPDEYVDWEICYHFWRNRNIGTGLNLVRESFAETVEEMISILSHGLAESIIDGQRYVSFVDLIKYSKSKGSAEIISFLDSLFSANKAYDDVIGELHQIPISRISNSIFGSNNDMQKKRKDSIEVLISYLIENVTKSWLESGITSLSSLNRFSPPIAGRTKGCYSLKETHRLYEIMFESEEE